MKNVSSPTSISPVLHARHRLASCSNQTKPRPHYLHMVTNANSYRMKANSLPSILDSDNEADSNDGKEDTNKSPTSTASYGKKKSNRSRPWRYLQRQRTTEEMTPLDTEVKKVGIAVEASQELVAAAASPDSNGIQKVKGRSMTGSKNPRIIERTFVS
jgi:hypothetical protein